MTYKTVFDITSAGYKSWPFPAFGLIFIAAGFLLFINRKSLPGWWGTHPRAGSIIAGFFLGFAVLWTVVSFFMTYTDYRSTLNAVEQGSVKTIEGPVTRFEVMPAYGHSRERFCVEQACFEYSDFVITSGFNNTSSHGGPIREGLQVQVVFIGNTIAKLGVSAEK